MGGGEEEERRKGEERGGGERKIKKSVDKPDQINNKKGKEKQ